MLLYIIFDSQDECSFVSLRDIERALIVFKYFYEKNSKFEELIAAKAKAEVRILLSLTIPFNTFITFVNYTCRERNQWIVLHGH